MTSTRPSRIVVSFISSARTDLALARKASEWLPEGVELTGACHDDLTVDEAWAQMAASDLVLVRAIGGSKAWPGALDVLSGRAKSAGAPPLVVTTGTTEIDSSVFELSTVRADVSVEANRYLVEGGPENFAQCVRFLCDSVLGTEFGFRSPEELPRAGVLLGPWVGELFDEGTLPAKSPGLPPKEGPTSGYASGAKVVALEGWIQGAHARRLRRQKQRPLVAVVFYRSHWLAGNMGFVEELCETLAAEGVQPLPLFCDTLREGSGTAELVAEALRDTVDCIVATVLASGGSGAAEAAAIAEEKGVPGELEWDPALLRHIGVPVIQGLVVTTGRKEWECSSQGLSPLDVAMQVAMAEFDGRIVGVPFCFKEREVEPSSGQVYVPDSELCSLLARLAAAHARLSKVPVEERRVAIVLSNYPSRRSRLGNAVALDTPASAIRLLEAMRQAGYRILRIPESGDALMAELAACGVYDSQSCTSSQLMHAAGRLEVERYLEAYRSLPQSFRQEVESAWGPPPGGLFVEDGTFFFFGIDLGNVFVTIQPARGYGENPIAIYHDPELPPSHHYLATYCWMREVYGAHAIVHLGKHGTLEWLPGKAVGLSSACSPQAVLGPTPLIYPFVVNDPGEGAQAKRRAHAIIVDHMIAPMQRAETYDELAELEQLLDEYYHVQLLDPSKVPQLQQKIVEVLRTARLDEDLGLSLDEATLGDLSQSSEGREDHDVAGAELRSSIDTKCFDEIVLAVDGYLCELKDARIRGGLHVLGELPPWPKQRDTLVAILSGCGRAYDLRRALGEDIGLDLDSLEDDPSRTLSPEETGRLGSLLDRIESLSLTTEVLGVEESAEKNASAGWSREVLGGAPVPARRALDALERAAAATLDLCRSYGWDAGRVAKELERSWGEALVRTSNALGFACSEVVPRMAGCKAEIDAVLSALGGRFIEPGPSGSPTRGLVNVMPTGRNFYTVDPRAIPSELAWNSGKLLANELIQRYLRDRGEYPSTVGLVVWGTAAMRTQGDDIAEALYLLGVEPVWDRPSRRVIGLELIPLERLGRPRIDVVLRISGFFRDAFPDQVRLFDDAVRMVVEADEDPSLNFPRRHVIEALGAGGMPDRLDDVLLRRATLRVFGSPPGCYGAGLLPLIDSKNWRDTADIAEVYATWGGYAYGRNAWGVDAKQEMRDAFARISVAVKNQDTREHDLFDSDDYFQYHGGMVATVRSIAGVAPAAVVADSSDPTRPRARSLDEEAHRVFRSRVANPRWIRAMMEHGYKGAFELAATVDYMFGYDATTAVVTDWMYETIAQRYVLDPEVREFMERANPWALGAIAERLLEAAERKMWQRPDPKVLDELRKTLLWLDAQDESAEEDQRRWRRT